MTTFKLYFGFINAYLKTKIEYRFAFFMDFFIHIYGYFITYLGIWVIFNKFHFIKGWDFYEVMFLYNLNLISYGICGVFFFTPIRRLEGMVKDGTFDSMLIKPINPFLHLIFRYFNHDFFGHIILAGIVFTICLNKLNIIWTIGKVMGLILFIFGATLIQAGLMIIAATVCFWFFTSNNLIDATIYGVRSFINYPITIYDKWIQIFLTFILPYAFVNFYPVQYFLADKVTVFHSSLNYLTPVIGIIIFVLAILLWNTGINRYQSTGS